MKKVAIIGTVGVPANYGGFETLVENILEHAPEGIEYTVFCSAKAYSERLESYKGARLKYLNIKANGAQSTLYDIVSMLKVSNKYDVALILGVSGCLFLPFFRLFFRNKLIINIDGLEHRREKWGRFARWFLKKSEAMAVRYADVIISDNKGIQDYVRQEYGKESVLIAYGGDQALRDVPDAVRDRILEEYGLEKGKYAVSVCRIEPENNCHIILEAFSKTDKRLVYLGNWDRSEYGQKLLERYSGCPNITMHQAVYDLDTLYVLRSNAAVYVHGHSAGGTNPSLVEAMFFGKPILAYDVVYNRSTTEGKAYYFKDAESLLDLLGRDDLDSAGIMDLATRQYAWQRIASQYVDLFE